MLELMRRLSEASARKRQALIDLERAFRDIVEIETEREFLRMNTRKH